MRARPQRSFNLGRMSKSSSTATDWQWDNIVHKANELVFVVGSYTINPNSTTDDSSSMWINPATSNRRTPRSPADVDGHGPTSHRASSAAF